MSINNPNYYIENPQFKKYYPVPITNVTYPFVESIYQYQDVNKDLKLRKNVTSFFTDQTISWINNDDSFKKHQSKLNHIKSVDGQMHIYKLLRKFVKRSGINWYDLRDNYDLIKKFIKHKL